MLSTCSWVPERNEDELEVILRWPGMIPSSAFVVGCQSIGCIRSSNWDEGLNFHFLMTVQITAMPPTAAAMTIRTVMVVCFPELLEGAAEDVAEAAAAVLVVKTVPNEAEGRALMLRVGMADEVRVDVGVLVTDDEEVVEVVTSCEVVGVTEVEDGGAETTVGVEIVELAMVDEAAEEADVCGPFPLVVFSPGSAAAPMTAGMPP
jgi:hypothetical protein